MNLIEEFVKLIVFNIAMSLPRLTIVLQHPWCSQRQDEDQPDVHTTVVNEEQLFACEYQCSVRMRMPSRCR
jgi:hypothetical protein